MKISFRLTALAAGFAVALGSSITPTAVSADSRMTSLGEHVAAQSKSSRAGWDSSTGVSKAAWASAVADETVKIDETGRAFVVEPRLSNAEVAASTSAAAPVHSDISLANALLLHSRPGSSRVIYLDFTGHDVTGSGWDDFGTFGVNSRAVPAYDVDGNFGSFNSTERQNIVDVWSAVAEDYSMFDVDVTTEEPNPAEIERSSVADITFGARAVITSEDNPIAMKCECGGIAYVGVFDHYPGKGNDWNQHSVYSPAFAFARPYFGGKTISDIVSHEVGHNLGLTHDGYRDNEYYEGRDGWAPIMGAGYNQPLVQWSNGTYNRATNLEDDLAVMQANGLQILVDDHGGSAGTSTSVELNTETDGVIRSRNDVDFFRFIPQSTSVDVSVNLPSVSPNLDVSLSVIDSNGTTSLATSNPNFSSVSYQTSQGLPTWLSVKNLTPGQQYFVKIDGVGFGGGSSTGYSDYGSLGDYRLLVIGSDTLGQFPSAPTPTITGQAKLGRKLTVSYGTLPSGVRTTQQWLRNGSTISGATKSKYKLKSVDFRKRISVRVTVSQFGYSPAAETSASTSKVRR